MAYRISRNMNLSQNNYWTIVRSQLRLNYIGLFHCIILHCVRFSQGYSIICLINYFQFEFTQQWQPTYIKHLGHIILHNVFNRYTSCHDPTYANRTNATINTSHSDLGNWATWTVSIKVTDWTTGYTERETTATKHRFKNAEKLH